MSDVPHVAIGDFCQTGSGGTPSRDQMARYYDGGTIPWVKSGELRESVITSTEEHVTEAALKETSVKLVSENALLVAMYGATVGRLGILGMPATTNQAVCHIVPDPARAEVRYLFRALETKVSEMLRRTVGGAQPNINQGIVRELTIPLPPLPEQRRIAAILDQADTLRTQRRAALAQLDSLTQSLFLDMFGDPISNPKKFEVKSLSEVATFFGGNSLPLGQEYFAQEGGYFLMKVSDMNLPGNEREIVKCQGWSQGAGSKASTCAAGSIVIPKRGGAIGTNKKRITTRETVLDPNLMAIHPMPKLLDLEFLFQWLLGFDLSSIASGSSVPQLNKQDLAPLQVPLPPLPLQQTFATRVQAIEALKAQHRAALAEQDALFASLQQRAFAGGL
ncbi:restriction endonuclease subunit S [Hydrogenophaga sp. MI9]|uniref:restriction endonuclease subunit S n=1 Tax=Hydrogenophaga sp. MI9 TaxID=3453719 RepID=UPI003EEAFF8A